MLVNHKEIPHIVTLPVKSPKIFMNRLIFSIFLAFCCLSAPLMGQGNRSPLKVGLGLTGLTYRGDLTINEEDYLRMYPGGNMFLQFANQKAFRLRLNAGFGKLVEQVDRPSLQWESSRVTNSYFETSIFYLDLRLMRYFLRKQAVQPYIGIGPGIFFFNPKDQYGNFLIDNIFTRESGEDFLTTVFVFPVTGGISLRLNKSLDISADYTFRLNMTDYVDNIGMLGEQSGRDQVHAFQVAVGFSLGERMIIKEKTENPEPPKEEPEVALEDFSLTPKDTEGLEDLSLDDEVDYLLYQEMPEGEQLPAPEAYYQSKNPLIRSSQTPYWLELEEKAIGKKLYHSLDLPFTLSQSAICEAYHISLDNLLMLNPGLSEPVKAGSSILLPDYEKLLGE
jgi:hypothetical protein